MAFFRVKTGNVFAQCTAEHTIQTFLSVFEMHLQTLPENEDIHYVMDNLASHVSYELCELVAKNSHIECVEEKELDTMDKRRR